jgi:hypothetical protein
MHVVCTCTGNRIENANQIVEWCKVHFATRDNEYNKRYFWEVKGEIYIYF